MKKGTIIAIIILVLGVGAVYVIKSLLPVVQKQFTTTTSDAKNMKGEVTIALDSWIGYFFLQSPVFRQNMRDEGYRINIVDDNADYPARMEDLKEGKNDFAVVTIDSYLLNGHKEDFPGTIILVIDESRGGDALVGWESGVSDLNKLKDLSVYKIAFTPESPSEHLLKSIGAHFGAPGLLDKSGKWRVPTPGAEEAYDKLINKSVDMAVIWEPFVSRALNQPGVIKLLGTEDTRNLIIDILVVNRNFSKKEPGLVSLLVKKYFQAQDIYGADRTLLTKDIRQLTGESGANTESMLGGVRWLSLQDNIKWFGVAAGNDYYQDELPASIESTVNILMENKDFMDNPLPNKDPYTILNSEFIENLYISGSFDNPSASEAGDSLTKAFTPLSAQQWNKLKVVGSLKLRPITFMSGTADLDAGGEDQLDDMAENIRHYPNFRIVIKGHTGVRGDAEANRLLSQQRSNAVKEYFILNYDIDENRLNALGVGGAEPLPKEKDESSRSYTRRLKRVEVYMVQSGF